MSSTVNLTIVDGLSCLIVGKCLLVLNYVLPLPLDSLLTIILLSPKFIFFRTKMAFFLVFFFF